MKKIRIIVVAILIANVFWGCEKDDICESGTPTTPRMIVEFYDNNNPTAAKTVTNLAIVAEGETDTLDFNGVSKIQVPLKTIEDITKYSFIFDSGNADVLLQNNDQLEINYSRNNVYISRACGYKTLFKLNNPNGITLTTDANNWIQEIVIQKYNILNEDEVHVKIFF